VSQNFRREGPSKRLLRQSLKDSFRVAALECSSARHPDACLPRVGWKYAPHPSLEVIAAPHGPSVEQVRSLTRRGAPLASSVGPAKPAAYLRLESSGPPRRPSISAAPAMVDPAPGRSPDASLALWGGGSSSVGFLLLRRAAIAFPGFAGRTLDGLGSHGQLRRNHACQSLSRPARRQRGSAEPSLATSSRAPAARHPRAYLSGPGDPPRGGMVGRAYPPYL
jgi:hypothetical protein